jgi:hypothetical protein
MRASPLLLLLPVLLGADCFAQVDDYLSNVVAEGVYLASSDPALTAELGGSGAATAFLARATSLSDIESNLLDDADRVRLLRGSAAVTLANEGSGTYAAVGDGDLVYSEGATYTLEVLDRDRVYTASAVAPPAPDLGPLPDPAVPEYHPAGQPITIDLTGQGFDNWVGVVLDDAGELTWDNRPQDVGDYLAWIGDSEAITTVQIPGSAFPNPGAAYVLGVAGIRRSADRDVENFNPLLTNFALGALSAAPISTAP